MPHCLFYGLPGTVRRRARAICKQLYGPELVKTRVKELNASDSASAADKIRRSRLSRSECPIPISVPAVQDFDFDEADAMTNDAQSAPVG